MASTQITIKSSRQNPAEKSIKARSCVSTAKLYDWSEGLGVNVTTPRLHREPVCTSRADKTSRFKTLLAICNGNKTSSASETDSVKHVTNGRMFVRDKKIPTKGEQKIIEGIYKNRGDATDRNIGKDKFMVTSHKEAWYFGKPVQRSLGLGKTYVPGVKIYDRVPNSWYCLNRDTYSESSAFCQTKRENTPYTSLIHTDRNTHDVNTMAIIGEVQKDERGDGCLAPPSTPDFPNLNLRVQQPSRYTLSAKRPLMPGLVLQTENIPVYNTNHSNIHEFNQREVKSPHSGRPKTVRIANSKSLPTLHRRASDAFPVSVLESPTATSYEVEKKSPGRQSENKQINNATYNTPIITPYNSFCSDWANAKETDYDKKVKVNIYLPTAEGDLRNNHGFISTVSVHKKQRCLTNNNMLPKL